MPWPGRLRQHLTVDVLCVRIVDRIVLPANFGHQFVVEVYVWETIKIDRALQLHGLVLVIALSTFGHKLVDGSNLIHEDDHVFRFVFGWESRPPAEALPPEQELVRGESTFSR